ncbi:MAG: A/G-specific adenine glycosylase [Rhodospirillales bacterium]|jgi:A/G-specific adenine glycosylase|nr:A/G-specific adenine glycosylase [Rhodospirillaceae bacterium]MDP6428143.1 A/G-specific adenine glycosylase [Rhodospirillales bacterium]MDP6642974.1 A/G-specific adenine glycosylase [Rhodospirillales bacterium]MDP6840729.1 A/G-specific adenine glycosylase [Rhodospirillales bacterium]
MDQKSILTASARLLAWYDANRRALPWRAAPGTAPDPYHVWLSEIMLQQTTVAAVTPYFDYFIERWPHIGALADASLDEVLHAWQGLGYYARARNLHKCAGIVGRQLGGRFPADEAALRRLPGIGPYTAAALAAIAFGLPAAPVDGNIERVIARLFALAAPLPKAKPRIKRLAENLTPESRAGDHAQAMMDLGAGICTPKRPECGCCPLAMDCAARAAGKAEAYPRKGPKKPKPTRRGWVFWARDDTGRVLIRRRPEAGLLGGMMEFPSTDWIEAPPSEVTQDAATASAPLPAEWRRLPGLVRHSFTHFHLELGVLSGECASPVGEGTWCAVEKLGEHALPNLMKKVARHAIQHAEPL